MENISRSLKFLLVCYFLCFANCNPLSPIRIKIKETPIAKLNKSVDDVLSVTSQSDLQEQVENFKHPVKNSHFVPVLINLPAGSKEETGDTITQLQMDLNSFWKDNENKDTEMELKTVAKHPVKNSQFVPVVFPLTDAKGADGFPVQVQLSNADLWNNSKNSGIKRKPLGFSNDEVKDEKGEVEINPEESTTLTAVELATTKS